MEKAVCCDLIWLHRLPRHVQGLAFPVLQGHPLDARNLRSVEVHRVLSADDQSMLVRGRQCPLFRVSTGQVKGWAFKRIKPPKSVRGISMRIAWSIQPHLASRM
jgi:hypothetical protein